MKKLFVNEQLEVVYDNQAQELLKHTNDLDFFDEGEKGIHKVTSHRWSTAQTYERKTWMSNPHVRDDRNFEHLERFGSLRFLRTEKIDETIELGCGPFTNMRLFSQIFTPKKITLLDPLISDYLNHPNCTYKNKKLNGIDVEIVSSPIESYETTKTYDAVVMINVIEHCYNVDSIFSKILSILKSGGLFIFSDVFFYDVKTLASNIYDAGHPLRLSTEKMESFLNSFDKIYEKRFNGLYSQDWRNDIYFIGKKL